MQRLKVSRGVFGALAALLVMGLVGCEAPETWCGDSGDAELRVEGTADGGYDKWCERLDGAAQGPFGSYDADGFLIAFGHYEDGEMAGPWRYYTIDELGDVTLERMETYRDGVACGTWLDFDEEAVTAEQSLPTPCR